jgi:hypothetical protein
MSEDCEKSRKLVCHMVNSNIAIDSLPTLQISLGIVGLFEKIYYVKPIVTVFSNIGEDYNTVVSMVGIV